MNSQQKEEIKRLSLGTIFFLCALFFSKTKLTPEGSQKIIILGAYLAAYIILGIEVFQEFFKNLLRGEFFDENFLMTIASAGAMALGDYPEAVAVLLFYDLGELFQDYAVDRSHEAIHSLLDLRPDSVDRFTENGLETVEPSEIKAGDLFLVKSGERIPLDGLITEGVSQIDLSALTGESTPVRVCPGDTILSGGINIGEAIKARAASVYSESTASRILYLVENAESKKADSEKFITRFAKVYTPIVVCGAFMLALFPPLFSQGNWDIWIRRALVFLVASCPCALVISIPLCFFGGIGGASRKGILIKGSVYLEALSHVSSVVMDKTGTLTTGSFSFKEIHPEEGFSENSLLEWIALAEAYNTHPIGKAILTAYPGVIDHSRIARNTEFPGMGVSAVIDGKTILAGNQKIMAENGINTGIVNVVNETVVYASVNGQYAGYLTFGDSIKEEAEESLQSLRDSGVRQIVMLTGDKKEAAWVVSERLRLDACFAELLPQDKVIQLKSILSNSANKEVVAFVGDGINDAPVLAAANVGIAMGALGSEAAIEAADIVIMDDDLRKISQGIRIAKRTMRILKENIILSLGIKLTVLTFAAFGYTGLLAAVLADTGTALIAILNALRTLKKE